MNEIEAGRLLFLFYVKMIKEEFLKVLEKAVAERACTLVELDFNDDDNVFNVTVDKENSSVELADCEYIHRAILDAFDRNIEDYSLTVSSLGIDPDEADEILKNIKD